MRRRVPSPPRRSPKGRAHRRLPAPPANLRTLAIAAAVLGVVLVAGYFWVRDSSFVSVRQVQVTGASGPDAPRIESALRSAAQDMTTLHLRKDALEDAVKSFPIVGGVEVHRDFPHGVRITVLERRPVAVATISGRRVPITADGRVLRGATAADDLPSIALDDPPSTRIEGVEDRRLLSLVATAPAQLRRRATKVSLTEHGLTLTMQEGPDLFFGTAEDLRAKWLAVARVLADPTTQGARYVDVRVPDRAAVGGLAPLVTPDQTEQPQDPATATPAPTTTTPVAPAPTPDPTVATPSPSTGA